jgi:hypothetical protein
MARPQPAQLVIVNAKAAEPPAVNAFVGPPRQKKVTDKILWEL